LVLVKALTVHAAAFGSGSVPPVTDLTQWVTAPLPLNWRVALRSPTRTRAVVSPFAPSVTIRVSAGI
jgi:hypothetical protein